MKGFVSHCARHRSDHQPGVAEERGYRKSARRERPAAFPGAPSSLGDIDPKKLKTALEVFSSGGKIVDARCKSGLDWLTVHTVWNAEQEGGLEGNERNKRVQT